MKPLPAAVRDLAPLAALMDGADHVDVKTFPSERSLRGFLLGLAAYDPAWLRLLYALRGVLAALFGLRHEPGPPIPTDERHVPMRPGERLGPFAVVEAREDSHWIALAEDRHLAAYLAVTADGTGPRPVFHVATVVRHKHWTGPLYFGLIRPAHHLVVRAMGRAAA